MMIFSALGRSAPIYVSGQLRGYAGTSSTWSMSRLWNNLKKGIGADKPVHAPKPTAAQVPIKEASPALKKTPNAIVENKLAEAKAATPMGGTDFLWQPKPTTISRAEIQRVFCSLLSINCTPTLKIVRGGNPDVQVQPAKTGRSRQAAHGPSS